MGGFIGDMYASYVSPLLIDVRGRAVAAGSCLRTDDFDSGRGERGIRIACDRVTGERPVAVRPYSGRVSPINRQPSWLNHKMLTSPQGRDNLVIV